MATRSFQAPRGDSRPCSSSALQLLSLLSWYCCESGTPQIGFRITSFAYIFYRLPPTSIAFNTNTPTPTPDFLRRIAAHIDVMLRFNASSCSSPILKGAGYCSWKVLRDSVFWSQHDTGSWMSRVS